MGCVRKSFSLSRSSDRNIDAAQTCPRSSERS
jgi:hypothetical protein